MQLTPGDVIQLSKKILGGGQQTRPVFLLFESHGQKGPGSRLQEVTGLTQSDMIGLGLRMHTNVEM